MIKIPIAFPNDNYPDLYLSIKLLDDNDSWTPHNGNMLVHIITTEGKHIDGYHIIGLGNEGFRNQQSIGRASTILTSIDTTSRDHELKIIGVDLI
jgi:hypothetical protein